LFSDRIIPMLMKHQHGNKRVSAATRAITPPSWVARATSPIHWATCPAEDREPRMPGASRSGSKLSFPFRSAACRSKSGGTRALAGRFPEGHHFNVKSPEFNPIQPCSTLFNAYYFSGVSILLARRAAHSLRFSGEKSGIFFASKSKLIHRRFFHSFSSPIPKHDAHEKARHHWLLCHSRPGWKGVFGE
jgi:hypothetical protein